MEAWVLYVVGVGAPILVLLLIQLLRGWFGVWHTGGADIIGAFIVLDFAVAIDPGTFSPLVFTPTFQPATNVAAVIGILAGCVLAVFSVLYGERRLALAEALKAQNAQVHFPFTALAVVWGSAIFYIAVHAGFVLGDWT